VSTDKLLQRYVSLAWEWLPDVSKEKVDDLSIKSQRDIKIRRTWLSSISVTTEHDEPARPEPRTG